MGAVCVACGHGRWLVFVLALLTPGSASALAPATELLVPALARTGPWTTDLYLLNPGDSAVEVRVQWLTRGRPNPEPAELTVTLGGGHSRALSDVILTGFGRRRAVGALRLISDEPIVAMCRVVATEGGPGVGQGVPAIPAALATSARSRTHVMGLVVDTDFRSNIYGVAGAAGARLALDLVDAAGAWLAAVELELGPFEPFLEPVDALFGLPPPLEGTASVEVRTGDAVVAASRIDNRTTDPTTLASWSDGVGTPAGTYLGRVGDGGIALVVDPLGRVAGLEFSYSSDGCPLLLAAGEDLSGSPLEVAVLGHGHAFSTSYAGGGSIEWRIELEPRTTGPGLTGTLTAVGSGWAGELAGCNGELPPREVAAGFQRPRSGVGDD